LHDEYPIDPANINVTLKLREDIPDPDGSGPLYSMPGKVLWSRSWRLYQQGSTFRNRAWSPLPVSRSPLITLSLYHLITRPG
jgi:hypothetical protein